MAAGGLIPNSAHLPFNFGHSFLFVPRVRQSIALWGVGEEAYECDQPGRSWRTSSSWLPSLPTV